ncbi:hypothetical protein [Natronorubrum sp. A-ect3]|uniref:hypothetical protein n=1 Tax=Natronorubrum sp. A-ect3 TaxID=3242698 RepID=UPI00359E1B91
MVEAIGDLEREIDELDNEIDISKEDSELAAETARRVELLYDVLSGLREQQALIIEADIERYRLWLDGVSRAIRKHGLDELTGDRDEVERYCSTMEKLVDGGRHERVINNDRFTLATIDNKLRAVDEKMRRSLDHEAHTRMCLGVYESLLDEIHESVAALSEENPRRTSHASDLRTVKQHLKDATAALDRDANEKAAVEARTALAGAQMLHYVLVRDRSDQRVAERLAAIIQDTGLNVDCDVSDCEASGDVTTLINGMAEAIGGEVKLSKEARLRKLLSEHDGDVIRTAEATDFDLPSILDHLEQLYSDDQIDKIVIEFST